MAKQIAPISNTVVVTVTVDGGEDESGHLIALACDPATKETDYLVALTAEKLVWVSDDDVKMARFGG